MFAVDDSHVVLIATDHDAVDYKRLAGRARLIVDTRNACHQAALQVPVVIVDPKDSSFPDQDFRPKQ